MHDCTLMNDFVALERLLYCLEDWFTKNLYGILLVMDLSCDSLSSLLL